MRKDIPMMKRFSTVFLCVAFAVGAAAAADVAAGLKSGSPDLKSAGPLAFAPDGVLLVGDPVGAAIFAIDTGDRTRPGAIAAVNVDGIGDKLAGMLGTTPQELLINDMAVNPVSGKVYLSVSRGKGPAALPVLARVEQGGKIEILPLENVKFAKAGLPNPPTAERQRMESIIDLAYMDNRVFVVGLFIEQFVSSLCVVPFLFKCVEVVTCVLIYHCWLAQLEY